MIAPDDTPSISGDPVESTLRECPACGFASPDGGGFSTCQRCGLIAARYREHQNRASARLAGPRGGGGIRFLIMKRTALIAGIVAFCLAAAIGALLRSRAAGKAEQDRMAQLAGPRELATAIQKNDVERVKQLLAAGADPNVAAPGGNAPVAEALLAERIEIARLLVGKGARIPQGPRGDAPSLAQECILKNLILSVSYLFSLHVPVDELTPKGFSPLVVAAANGYVEMVKMLVDHGMSVNTRDTRGGSPLLEASRTGNTEMVRLLIKLGADVNAHDRFGYAPLMWGVQNTDIAAMLIDAGADINARSDTNKTPLHSAVSALNLQAVKLLVEKGADVNARDDRGVTPLKITTFHRNPDPDPFPEMAALLKKAGGVP